MLDFCDSKIKGENCEAVITVTPAPIQNILHTRHVADLTLITQQIPLRGRGGDGAAR